MRKSNKLTQVTAIALSSLLCFTACAGQPAKESSESKNTQSSSLETVGSQEEKEMPYWELLDTVSDTSELPDWPGETLEVNVWYAAGSSTTIGDISETDVVYKEIERVTGVKFNVDECFDNGGNSLDAKLPMVIASKDLPTIIMGHDIDSQIEQLYEEGYLADLSKYYTDGTLDQLLKYMPLEDCAATVYNKCLYEDGTYYRIPNYVNSTQTSKALGNYVPEDLYDPTYYATYGTTPVTSSNRNTGSAILVREDILQALVPEALTIEEIRKIYVDEGAFTEDQIYDVNLNSSYDFFQFLRDVKELLAGGEYVGTDGKVMEVMAGPHTETDNWLWMSYLPQLVDSLPDGTNYFATADYTPEAASELMIKAYESDYYVNFMKELNALVRDDVIAQDSLLDNAAQFEEKCLNSHYAVLYGTQFIAYDKGVEGYRPIWINTPYNQYETGAFSVSEYKWYFSIFKDVLSEEQLDQLMHAINYFNSEVGIKNFYWGPKTAGLFTEDENGRRSYTDSSLKACIIDREVNGADAKYGLIGTAVENPVFTLCPKGVMTGFCAPEYLEKPYKERVEKDAFKYFNPGTLPGKSLGENTIYVKGGCNVYGTLGVMVDGLNKFWEARNGFENQMKKVIAAETDEQFDKQLNELFVFAEKNGFTDEALKEFNDIFVDANREVLQKAGIIE